MEKLLSTFKISVQESIYIKDPESSELGKRIVKHSIELIDEIGFDAFTFKKLGARIGSNESSVYRYFDNKHKLLIYLTSWYWAWLEYQLVMETYSISDPVKKLKQAIQIISKTVTEDSNFTHIDEVLLNRIIIEENSKSYLTKLVDQENQEGYFSVYKRLITRLKNMISSIDSSYPHPASLASTIVETGIHQHFLRRHFPSITDCNEPSAPINFLTDLALKALKVSQV